MKIHVLGGGPAGLYFAILAKKADPSREVIVFERNAADDTFGWGVVFSDETLGNLEHADEATYRAIRENFATWDAIDVHSTWKGEASVVRSGGHGFCGIGRMRLLLLLQKRARELGVVLHFGREIEDTGALRECDLLVAADGVNSRTRDRYAEAFEPSITVGGSRFIWLGTHQRFEAFTFIFRENDDGVFQVHAYQFDDATSTFIVECDEASWRAAGLDRASEEESIAYCETLFAPELDGHALLANRSRWIQFSTVRCARWHHENVVLLGDAAHTAHFSVGSGTKLAMEDAIGLSEALTPGRSVPEALAAYADAREPLVARTQRAAEQSQEWFAQTRRHLTHHPQRLMFSLLSRTRRVTHENLRVRDPGYIEQVDRFFMEEQGVESARVVPPMFAPLDVAGMQLHNRVVVSPMCQYSATDGVPNDWHMVHLGSRAIGGAGLVFAEMTNVSADARITPGCTGMWNDAQEAAWLRITDFVHANSNAKIAMQLGHAGRKGATRLMWEGMDAPLPEGMGWPLLGPSPIPWRPENIAPKEMDRADMKRVRDDFVSAAERSARAGFDLLEVHFAHGYLLSSFLTPLTNRRGDEFGGTLENRARFPLEVLDAVRQVWSGPLSVRISATDWVPEGFQVDDAVALSFLLAERGVDLVDVSAGQTSPQARPVYGRAFQTPFSERIRNEVGIKTMTVGNIFDHDRVNTILAAGRADLVALARAHLADPYFTLHAAAELGHGDVTWPVQYGSAGPVALKMFED